MPITKPYNTHDHAVAKLALQLSNKQLPEASLAPSDEELAALYDNKLNNSRREQILKHIASNENIYRKWINLIDSISIKNTDQVTSTVVSPSTQNHPTKTFLWQKIHHWWASSTDFSPVMGSGFAMASVIVFVVLLAPFQQTTNLSDDLTDFYKQYGVSLSEQSSNSNPNPDFATQRSFSFSKEVPEYAKILRTGFIVGSQNINPKEYEKWGYDLHFMQIIKPSQTTKYTTQQYNILFEVGRLTALTALPCRLNPKTPDTAPFYIITKQLISQLNDAVPVHFSPIMTNYLKQGNKSHAVCAANRALSLMITG